MAEGTAEVRVEEGASKVIEDEAALNLVGGSNIPSGGALVTMAAGSNQDAAKEEFDFDPGDVEGTVERKWFAMARYYSAQRSKGLFAEMGAAWRSEKPIPVRPLDDNRFILEFEDEEIYKFVINGGPWRHKGDALIVMPYDGLTRPSEVVIDSIDLWLRFYDVPVSMIVGYHD